MKITVHIALLAILLGVVSTAGNSSTSGDSGLVKKPDHIENSPSVIKSVRSEIDQQRKPADTTSAYRAHVGKQGRHNLKLLKANKINFMEEGYQLVKLPFSFIYYDLSVDTIYLSPNGSIYFQDPKTTLSDTRINMLDVIHTKLSYPNGENEFGVRFDTTDSSIKIQWYAVKKSENFIPVFAEVELKADQSIVINYQLNEDTLPELLDNSTVLIRGAQFEDNMEFKKLVTANANVLLAPKNVIPKDYYPELELEQLI